MRPALANSNFVMARHFTKPPTSFGSAGSAADSNALAEQALAEHALAEHALAEHSTKDKTQETTDIKASSSTSSSSSSQPSVQGVQDMIRESMRNNNVMTYAALGLAAGAFFGFLRGWSERRQEAGAKQLIPTPKYFDATLSSLFYRLAKFRNYNEAAYTLALRAADAVMSENAALIQHPKQFSAAKWEFAKEAHGHAILMINTLVISITNEADLVAATKIRDAIHDRLQRNVNLMYAVVHPEQMFK